MNFSYGSDVMLDAYEWVLLDCMSGDQMLFLRREGVELSWSLLTPLIDLLAETAQPEDFPNYPAGSEGPESAKKLVENDGRSWRPIVGGPPPPTRKWCKSLRAGRKRGKGMFCLKGRSSECVESAGRFLRRRAFGVRRQCLERVVGRA